MSIFGSILNKIFHPGEASASTAPQGQSPSAATASAPAQPVDIAALLDQKVAAKKEHLEWRTSIVDMMKALDLDSSLNARQTLANELHYQGDTKDSAKMNLWLHQEVMKQLAQNGGVVPDDLKKSA